MSLLGTVQARLLRQRCGGSDGVPLQGSCGEEGKNNFCCSVERQLRRALATLAGVLSHLPADHVESHRELTTAELGSAWHFNSHESVGVVGGTGSRLCGCAFFDPSPFSSASVWIATISTPSSVCKIANCECLNSVTMALGGLIVAALMHHTLLTPPITPFLAEYPREVCRRLSCYQTPWPAPLSVHAI